MSLKSVGSVKKLEVEEASMKHKEILPKGENSSQSTEQVIALKSKQQTEPWAVAHKT